MDNKPEERTINKKRSTLTKDRALAFHLIATVLIVFFLQTIRLALTTAKPTMPGVPYFSSLNFKEAFEEELKEVTDFTDGIEALDLFNRLASDTPLSTGMVNLSMQDTVSYLQRLNELGGNRDAQLEVSENLEQFGYAPQESQDGEAVGANITSPIYAKKDLEDWVAAGLEYQYSSVLVTNSIDQDGDTISSYDQINLNNMLDARKVLEATSASDSPNFLDEMVLVKERVAPIGYPSLLAFANAERQTLDRVEDQTAKILTHPLITGKGYEKDQPMTNLRYKITYPLTYNSYSNSDSGQFKEAAFTAPIHFSREGAAKVSTGPHQDELNELYNEGYYSASVSIPRESVFFIDTNFSIQDRIAGSAQTYPSSQIRFWVALVGLLIFGLIWLISLITILVRVEPDKDSFFFSLEQKLPVEVYLLINFLFVALLIAGGRWICQSYSGVRLPPGKYNSPILDLVLFLISFLGLALDSMIIFLLSSIARKIKLRRFYRGSLLEAFFQQGRFLVNYFFSSSKKSRLQAYLVTASFLLHIILVVLMVRWKMNLMPLWLPLFLIGMFYVLRSLGEKGQLIEIAQEIVQGKPSADLEPGSYHGMNKALAEALQRVDKSIKEATERTIKNERLQTELITNISHDIRTPLTSIINYTSLLKQEEHSSSRVDEYIQILDNKANRLKNLMDNLIDASRASTGSSQLDMIRVSFNEVIAQMVAEYEDAWRERGLYLVCEMEDRDNYILADGFHLSRVLDNIFSNVNKYALSNTRVYLSLKEEAGRVIFEQKNISAQSLNMSPEALMERFARGDRSRTTEGSGLGLAIARNTVELMDGKFTIQIDGDLYKVTIEFASLT